MFRSTSGVSSYSNQLTNTSPQFARPFGSAASYYYQAIQVTVPIIGSYTFISSSTFDAYGIIYADTFLASEPMANIIAQDDGANDSGHFYLTAYLKADIPYVLVFTTNKQNKIGSFSIVASGPDQVTFKQRTN